MLSQVLLAFNLTVKNAKIFTNLKTFPREGGSLILRWRGATKLGTRLRGDGGYLRCALRHHSPPNRKRHPLAINQLAFFQMHHPMRRLSRMRIMRDHDDGFMHFGIQCF